MTASEALNYTSHDRRGEAINLAAQILVQIDFLNAIFMGITRKGTFWRTKKWCIRVSPDLTVFVSPTKDQWEKMKTSGDLRRRKDS